MDEMSRKPAHSVAELVSARRPSAPETWPTITERAVERVRTRFTAARSAMAGQFFLVLVGACQSGVGEFKTNFVHSEGEQI